MGYNSWEPNYGYSVITTRVKVSDNKNQYDIEHILFVIDQYQQFICRINQQTIASPMSPLWSRYDLLYL